jgi:hypothetical protein
MKWTPDTIACFIVIVAGLALRFTGIDGEVWSLVLTAFGFLIGSQYQMRKGK